MSLAISEAHHSPIIIHSVEVILHCFFHLITISAAFFISDLTDKRAVSSLKEIFASLSDNSAETCLRSS
jgi:hypothetical protein